MKNKDMVRALSYAVKQLECEWERTGKTTRVEELDKGQLHYLFHEVQTEIGFRNEVCNHAEEIPFEDSLVFSHENYILLRLGKKVYKAITHAENTRANFSKLMLDKEEAKIYDALMERE